MSRVFHAGLPLAIVALAAVGCASTNYSHPDVQRARDAYNAAAASPGMDMNSSLQMYEAKKELAVADQMLADGAPQATAAHYAYLAETRVKIAKLQAETTQLEKKAIELDKKQRDQLAEARQTERGLVLTLGGVLFAFNKADLKPEAETKVARVAGFLVANPDREVLIEGHTDSVGTEQVNLELSEKRAYAVRTALIMNGVGPERLVAEGYGKAYPVASNDTQAGRDQNRRVEIVILKPGERAEVAQRARIGGL